MNRTIDHLLGRTRRRTTRPARTGTRNYPGRRPATIRFRTGGIAGGQQDPVVAAIERSTDVQPEMWAELNQVRGYLALLSQPVNRQRIID